MTNESQIDIGTLRPNQLGYVYKDIEKHAKVMETFFGASKFIIFDPVEVDVIVHGVSKRILVRSGFGRIFDTEIELLQPVEGDSIYTEFLNEGREGLHHVSYKVENISAYINEFKKRGIRVLQWGILIKLVYVYLDTEEFFNIILEFTEELKRGMRSHLSF